MSDSILSVRGLKKAYGSVKAVDGIDFSVNANCLFAFLGPNGAGKSTTIDILSTLLSPDGGEADVCGHRIGKEDNAIRRRIGVVFQDGLLDGTLTIEENLRIRGGFYGLSGAKLNAAVDFASGAAGVNELRKRRYGKLSGGQRRRADIARALVNTPELLFLDEPSTGLDPQTRRSVWDTIASLRRDSGMTVFLTTHYMEEAAGADDVVIIDNGKIAAQGSPAVLKERYTTDSLLLHPLKADAVRTALSQKGLSFTQTADTFRLALASPFDALALVEMLRPFLAGFEVVRGSMDDVFLAVTGKELRE